MAALVARYQARLGQALDVWLGESRVPLDARNAALRAGETTLATGSPTSCEPACTPTWPSAIERARVIAPAIEGRIVPASP